MTPHSNCQEQHHEDQERGAGRRPPAADKRPACEHAAAHGDFADWSAEELKTYADLGGTQ